MAQRSAPNLERLTIRAREVVFVRLIALRVLLTRWWARPPRPREMARALADAGRILRDSGPLGLLRSLNAGTHALAVEGGHVTGDLLPAIHRRLEGPLYRRWVRRYDRLSQRDVEAIRDANARLAYRPLFSILMPVYNTDAKLLRAAIDSVRAQLYENWELCIADDCSTDVRVGEVLRHAQSLDSRIKVHFRTVNGHMSAASNSALELASGEFIVLLDHDDTLPIHALAAVAHELNHHPDADIVYSDEDRLDDRGRRYGPYFKPDWNPELFFGQNFINHLGVYRSALVRRVGGFREGFEGSQDHDLALRVIEQTRPERIRHVPHVLYHWRAVKGSAARAVGEKTYAYAATRRAVQEHLDRTGVHASCEPAPRLNYHQRIRYSLPQPRPHVTIIIPTRDRIDVLSRCVRSVTSRSTYGSYDVVVVDNGSTAEDTRTYFDELRRDSRFSILRVDEPFNFSRLNNLAAAGARGSVLCFLNNDTEVISADWLEEMVGLAIQSGVGAVGAMLYYPNNVVQHAGVIVGLGGVAGHAHLGLPKGAPGYYGRAVLAQAMSAVTAACLVVRKSVFADAGGFDETLAVAYNDVDFCLRLQSRGLRNVWTPFAELYHFEGASRGRDDMSGQVRPGFLLESQIMKDRWADLLSADPHFNRNLSLDSPHFLLAKPPRHTRRWWEN